MKKLNLTVAFMLLIVLMPSGTQSQNWVQWGNASDCLDFEGFFADSTGQNLYAKGRYLDEFGDTIHGLAKWDSTDWENIGYVSTHCSSVVQYKNLLCAANNLYGSLYVYCWDGMHWDTLGNQLGFYVNNMVVYKENLYAMGFGTNAIAKWNDTTWISIPTLSALTNIRAAYAYNDELYIGGFWDAVPENLGIMRWDGQNWNSVGNGILPSNFICDLDMDGVFDFDVYNNELYAAGCFFNYSGHENPDNCIGRWNGNNWNEAGGGLDAMVYKMAVYNGELYACGEFFNAGGIPADGIAKWDGTNWCSLGSEFTGRIHDMVVYKNNLIVGGNFIQIDGQPISYIAKWTGGAYTDTCGNMTGVQELAANADHISIYPNPASDYVNIDYNIASEGGIEICIYNYQGVKSLYIALSQNKGNYKLNTAMLAKGLYLISITSRGRLITSDKLIIIK